MAPPKAGRGGFVAPFVILRFLRLCPAEGAWLDEKGGTKKAEWWFSGGARESEMVINGN